MKWNTRGDMLHVLVELILDTQFSVPALGVTWVQGSRCPDDVVTEVFSCMSNLTGFGGKSLIVGGDVHILTSNCREGGFIRVTNCVQRMFANCHSKRDVDVLAKLADVSAMRTAFANICLKLEVYANSSECMQKQDPAIQSCMIQEYGRFRRGLQKILSAEEIFTKYCQYIKGSSSCIELPIRSECNNEVADVLADFMAGVTPPLCSEGSRVKWLPPLFLICSGFAVMKQIFRWTL